MKFVSRYIGRKILVLAGVVLAASLLAVILFYARHQEQGILAQNEANMKNLSDSVSKGLQTVMLAGYADIAHAYAEGLRQVTSVRDFRIMRINGLEAFQDNKTIASVNTRIGEEEFLPREEEKEVRILDPDHPELKLTLETGERVSFHGEEGGEEVLTFLLPIKNVKECHRCHGSQQGIRGILKLTTSLAEVREAIRTTREDALRVSAISLAASLALIFALIQLSVVKPIRRVTSAMTEVAKGDFDQKVPVLGQDELGHMAESFNLMSEEVLRSYAGLRQEQNKLTTIILSAREGMVVTDATGKVVLVNPAAERILEKSEEEIVQGGLFNIMDDPNYVQAFLERGGSDMPDTLVYKGRILNFHAATIRNKAREHVGSAALIRDVTEEKKLMERLQAMSFTDKLTGLNNRRRMEDILTVEFARAKRYSLDMALLFFDVDHFKRFNDTHGHDMGDRVLETIGKVAKDHFRNVDFPCRYGGEEFCIILPNTDPKGALFAADRFRQKMEATVVEGLTVTVSIGVACYPNTLSQTGEELLKAADMALYQAKRAGRNQVKLWENDS